MSFYSILQRLRPHPMPQNIFHKKTEIESLKAQLLDLEQRYKQKHMTTFFNDHWRLYFTPFFRSAFKLQPLPQTFY